MGDEKAFARLWRKCRVAYRADMPALAAARARELVEMRPLCGPAWRLLGSALVALARYPEATAAIHRALALCPPDLLWIPLAEMGHLYKAGGSYDTAACWYRRAIDAAPSQTGPRIYLGGVLAMRGELDKAERVLRAAVACAEGCRDEALLNLGQVLRALGRLDEAAECLAEALAIDPEYEPARLALRDVRCAAAHSRLAGVKATERRVG